MTQIEFTTEELQTEEWRSVPGRDGLYEVSNLGRVRSYLKRGNAINKRRDTPKLINPSPAKGYPEVTLQGGTKYRVHQLVLEAFDGPCPSGLEGCHGDGDRTNNRKSNLRWDSHQANAADQVRHGRCYLRRGGPSGTKGTSRLPAEAISEIRTKYTPRSYSQRRLGREYGVSQSLINKILAHK